MIEDPVLLWSLVGTAAGIFLGLTGTGGGVIAIPILMTFGGYNIKEASAYSLLVLTFGATISWFFQRENTVYPVAAVLILFASIFAFISTPLKAISPNWLVNALLNLTCLFSLYSLWILRKTGDPDDNLSMIFRLKTASIGGAIMGFFSTMTGLGGGVLIIPWLTGITRLAFDQAIACSLLTIAVTAPFSAWRQGNLNLSTEAWISLIIPLIITSFIVKKLTSSVSHLHMILVRKLTLTGVIIVSMMRTLAVLF
ncbi:MAG: sulfite exporter TauE/SafE family protein [Alphaproteobacteria bacterium]|nr:sulfite exporter TauE/SafE family protein [Alphaproteobacteria bacterium]